MGGEEEHRRQEAEAEQFGGTFCVGGKLLSVTVDVSYSVGLNGDVGFHQSVFLQQVLHTQQVFAVILREQQHLPADRGVKGRRGDRRSQFNNIQLKTGSL